MGRQIRAIVEDDDTVVIDGRSMSGQADFVEAIKAALDADPGTLLVIEPRQSTYFKGIGKVIYASQHAGLPVENLRYAIDGGEVLTSDQLRARLTGA